MRNIEKLLSVIIVTYNNGTELTDCIESIYLYNDIGDGLEVIVVDNSPTDCVEKLLNGRKEVIFIKGTKNGFGAGNNEGYRHSSGKYLLFLNPDTLLTSPCFQKMISEYEKRPDAGTLGVRLIDATGKENNSYNLRMKYGLFKKFALQFCYKMKLFIPQYMYTCGADILIERKHFEEIGCFDEEIFMYGEEEDLAYRLDKMDKYGVYLPDIEIIHLQGQSTGNDDLKNRKQMLASCKYICEKYGIDYKREVKKEARAMNFINGVREIFGKEEKYSSEIVNYYEEQYKG